MTEFDKLVKKLWKWFQARPLGHRALGWIFVTPVVGAVYFWQRGEKWSRVLAVVVLMSATPVKVGFQRTRSRSGSA